MFSVTTIANKITVCIYGGSDQTNMCDFFGRIDFKISTMKCNFTSIII